MQIRWEAVYTILFTGSHSAIAAPIYNVFQNENMLLREGLRDKVEKIWLSNFNVTSENQDYRKVLDLLSLISDYVTELIGNLKDKWLYINDRDEHPDGIIICEADELLLGSLWKCSHEAEYNVDLFAGLAVDLLSESIRDALETAGNVLVDEKLPEFTRAMDKFGRMAAEIESEQLRSSLISGIVSAKNHGRRYFEDLASWLVLSEGVYREEFEATFCGEVARESFLLCHDLESSQIEIDVVDESFVLEGEKFCPLVNIVFALLGNAYSHCGLPSSEQKIMVTFNRNGDRLEIVCHNSFNPEGINLNEVDSRIRYVEENGWHGKAAVEGRSGLPKIYRTAYADLGCECKIDYNIDEGNIISVGVELEGARIANIDC